MKRNKYKDYYVSKKTISTAIFEYLERKGLRPDRKRGMVSVTSNGGWETGGKFVRVKLYENN